MVLKNSIYKTIKKGIDDEIYKRIRLIKVTDDNEKKPLTTYSSYLKGGKENCLKQLEYIRFQLENKLPNGTYIVQVNTAPVSNGIDEDFIIKKEVTIQLPQSDDSIQDHTHTQTESDMSGIDIDDYKEALKELADYKSICQAQVFKIEMLEKEIKDLKEKKSLSDEETEKKPSLQSALAENVETIFGTLDAFLKLGKDKVKLENRKMDLAEKGVQVNGSKSSKTKKIKKTTMPKNEEIDYDKVVDEMEILWDQDETEFNKAMDELEKANPDLYNYVCEQLEIDDVDDDEDEDEEEQEEEGDDN